MLLLGNWRRERRAVWPRLGTGMKIPSPALRVARMGLLFALALALSLLEAMLAPLLPVPLPGVRLGLSNVAVMYCLFLLGPGQALLLGCLKALFALYTRGMSAALLSACGGLCSIALMLFVRNLPRRGKGKDEPYTAVSIAGAVAHNAGQLAGAAILLRGGAALWYYLPPLVITGGFVGCVTGMLLPALAKTAHRR